MKISQLAVLECEDALHAALKTPKIAELLNSTNPSPIIACVDCDRDPDTRDLSARALIRDTNPLQIDLCVNKLSSRKVEEALTHELVHAFDFSRQRCDFSSCVGLAYSEVRAAKLAECSSYQVSEWLRNKCIRYHAVKSTQNLFPRDAKSCVDRAFKEAVEDNEPFVKDTKRC